MGTGGARLGAGRPAHKLKAEHTLRINVRRWNREGLLRPGAACAWVWRDGSGQQTGAINFKAEAGAVVLDYLSGGTPVQQRVTIELESCHFGGARPWFRCPKCWRRSAVLFLRSETFGCRGCKRISYASQSEDAVSRTWRRQLKVEAQLGADHERPKGMHRSTHERLLDEIEACKRRRNEALAGLLAQLLRSTPSLRAAMVKAKQR